MFSERATLFLADIVEDIDSLTRFIDGMDVERFSQDEKTVLAVERLFQRITEAVIQVGPTDMALVGAELPIRKIRAFGNRLRHDYRSINPRILLAIAREDLPALREAAARALET